MFSCKSQIHHFSICISITLVQGTVFIFLGYRRSLLTGPPKSTLPPSSLFCTLCISKHNLIMPFSPLKMLQVLHIYLNSLVSPASVSDPCCHCVHPSAQLSPGSLFIHTGLVAVPWACNVPSCHRLLHLRLLCLQYSYIFAKGIPSYHPDHSSIVTSLTSIIRSNPIL